MAVVGAGQLAQFEQDVAHILEAVYDDAIGYSLRDRDDQPGPLDAVGPIKRFRPKCRTAENLLLAQEVLANEGIEWSTLKERVQTWVMANGSHPHASAFAAFHESGLDRRNADLKEIRNDLVGLMASNKPWEVLVGQAIAGCAALPLSEDEDGMRVYLGEDTHEALVR